MALADEQRRRMIRRAVLRNPEHVLDASAELWRTLALQLITIIGESGFETLYARTLHQTSIDYPWLASPVAGPCAAIFSDLSARMQECGMPDAGQANIALLIKFIDILSLLIGEPVTTTILRAAWGNETVNNAGTESE
jgi:hypothetical protein